MWEVFSLECIRNRNGKNRRKRPVGRLLRGSTVVEMSYIMPVFLILFLYIVNTVFYFHDKAVLNGAACETAVLSAQQKRMKEYGRYDMEEFFRERIHGKLITMNDLSVSVADGGEEVTVSVTARSGRMRLNICQKAVTAVPEELIRWMN